MIVPHHVLLAMYTGTSKDIVETVILDAIAFIRAHADTEPRAARGAVQRAAESLAARYQVGK